MKTTKFALLVGAAVGADIEGDKGIAKVITLLEDLKSEIETEAEAEHKTYDEFACFCKDKTDSKSTSVEDGHDSIDTLSADIQEESAERDDKQARWDKRRDNEMKWSDELKEIVTMFEKDSTNFQYSKADLDKAIKSIKGAVESLKGGKSKGAALLKLRRVVNKYVGEADALSMISDKQQKTLHSMHSLLETGVDPDDPDYKFKSQPLIDLLEKLETDYEEKVDTVEKEHEEQEEKVKKQKKALTDELGENNERMVELKEDIEKLVESIAQNREDLVEAEEQMKDDKSYLAELTSKCHRQAVEFDQRATMRAGEVDALTSALDIMKDKVKGWEDAEIEEGDDKKDKFVQTAEHPVAVTQEATARKLALSFLQRNAPVVATALTDVTTSKRTDKAIQMLSKDGQRLHSAALTTLAMNLGRPDPFKKVKAIVQGLIERLLNEAKTEAEHKGFCDEKTGMLVQDRDYRYGDVKKIHAELKLLRSKKKKLGREIKKLKKEFKELQEALDEAQKLRDEEHAENVDTLIKAKSARDAVEEALFILKVFYKMAGRGKVLLQETGPADKDANYKSKGAYQGNQAKATALLRQIEALKKEFESTISETEADEKSASEEHVEFKQTSESDIAGKKKKVELDKADKKETKKKIGQKMDDIQANSKLLDKALEELKDVKPMCFENGMGYDARVEKREEEMASLKLALCILDPNGDEEDCKKEEEEEE